MHTVRESTSVAPAESAQNWFGLGWAAATVPRLSVADVPGAGAISRSAVLDLAQTWIGAVNVPVRQSTVVAVIEFSLAAIQELTVAEVAPEDEANVIVHDDGAAIAAPVGVDGFGIRPSLSAGAWPAGSTGKALAVTGGAGCATAASAAAGAAIGDRLRQAAPITASG